MKENFDYRTIKTFEDACAHIGLSPEDFTAMFELVPRHIQALIKIEVITKAVNNGWVHPLDGTTAVYYPAFRIYSKEDQARVERGEWKDEHPMRLLRADGSAGLGSADSHNAWSYSGPNFGSRLALETRAKARYVATTFKYLYAAYLCPQPGQVDVDGRVW